MRPRVVPVALLLLAGVVAGPASSAGAVPTCGGWSYVTAPQGPPPVMLAGVTGVPGTDMAWAVGPQSNPWSQGLAMLWDGSGWRQSATPSLGQWSNLYGVAAISASDVWAVGAWGENGATHTLAEHWDGSSWRVVPSPDTGFSSVLTAVTALSATDVWAVGYDGEPVPTTVVEHWDGVAWGVVPSPNGPGTALLNAVTAAGPDDVWAVGAYGPSPYGTPAFALSEHWDGSGWSLVSVPTPDGASNMAGVVALASNDVWAVGRQYHRPGVYVGLIAHWDGSVWSLVRDGMGGDANHELYGIAAFGPDDVWAVGAQHETSNSYYHTLAEHWDGTAWSLGASLDGPYGTWFVGAAVLPSASSLFAVGARTATGAPGGPRLEPLTEQFC